MSPLKRTIFSTGQIPIKRIRTAAALIIRKLPESQKKQSSADHQTNKKGYKPSCMFIFVNTGKSRPEHNDGD